MKGHKSVYVSLFNVGSVIMFFFVIKIYDYKMSIVFV